MTKEIKDYSIRVKSTAERDKILERSATGKKRLPQIEDVWVKPSSESLTSYHPSRIITRLRSYTDTNKPATLMELKFTPSEVGYSDERVIFGEGPKESLLKKAQELDYSAWGTVVTTSMEYNLDLEGGAKAQVLSQQIEPIGTFLKIESKTKDGLEKTLKLLKAEPEKTIEKNAALLTAEYLGLVKKN